MLYTNWLIAIIIQGYEVTTGKKRAEDTQSGIIDIEIYSESKLVFSKYSRSVVLFWRGLVSGVKNLKFCKNKPKEKDKDKDKGKIKKPIVNIKERDKETDKLKGQFNDKESENNDSIKGKGINIEMQNLIK
jgi:hypothetical protein